MAMQCNLNSLKCAVLNGVCSNNPCIDSVGEVCPWGCKRSGEGVCVADVCASYDVRTGDTVACLSDEVNRCIYNNNHCEVDPCSLHGQLSECVSDIENKCVYDGRKCSQNLCEIFGNDLNLCSVNTRCAVISGKCYENPCDDESCDDNLCITTLQPSKCVIDPCASHKASDAECSIIDGCVVKVVETDRMCISGGCEDLSESESCKINGKCVFSKDMCSYDTCRGLNEDDCIGNTLCYVGRNKDCAFDLCNEGSGLNDIGSKCSSMVGCGYEEYDDTCKIATAKFTNVNAGSIHGIV
jgi:hypothetical protein